MINKQPNLADYVVQLNMNGLSGRMLYLPAPPKKKRNILIIYGHHASIERMFGLAEDLNKYGSITIPDLPGFGGMQSFHRIREKPSLDNLADYMAAFVKMRYKRKKVTIMGISFGFLVVTRMLQKYPELERKVDTVVSVVGFVHHEDFKFSRKQTLLLKAMAKIFSYRVPALFTRYVILRKPFIHLAYSLVADRHSKLKDADQEERRRRINFEVGLWQSNEIRTYMQTTLAMLNIDLCKKQINKPVYHIEVGNDRYFDNRVVEQHLNIIYKRVHAVKSKMPAHAPTVIANAKEAAPLIPRKVRRMLAKAA